MDRPTYMDNYNFNWETFDIMASGTSALDAKNYLANFNEKEDAVNFLKGYGYDISDPIQNAEMFGNFQEAIQFIKRYFLKEGNPGGLDFEIPHVFYTITDVSELLLFATSKSKGGQKAEEAIWASIILKVMHTILHLDKDIRYQYFTVIQTQIFDRFYKYLHRVEGDLFFGKEDDESKIRLVEFETKSKKSRESTIIKLLHKKENVAEELFDRIGIRFITHSKLDSLMLMHSLHQNYIIMVNNIKPSRSQNSLIDLDSFKEQHANLIKIGIKEKLTEEEFAKALNDLADECITSNYKGNTHTAKEYSAIHFTCRQLIKYKNPFYQQFLEMRAFAKTTTKESGVDSEITKRLLDLDTSTIAKDIRFFYPFEVQITDKESHKENSDGDASHNEYKKSQLVSAQKRLFSTLIDYTDSLA